MRQFYIDSSGVIKYRTSTPATNIEERITEENGKEDSVIEVV